MIYVFDIDGTICSKVSDGDYTGAMPYDRRIKTVNRLYEEGNTIIFQTARGMGRSNNNQTSAWENFEEMTRNQLIEWGVNFHALFMGKPAGDIYIDDKGMMDTNFFDQHREQ